MPRPRDLPGGYAPVSIAFLRDPRPTVHDRAVYAAVVSSLDFEKLEGNVRLSRIAERAGVSRRTAGRSLRRISVWGYWTMGRAPGGSWRFALEVAHGVASDGSRPRAPDSLESDATYATSRTPHDGEVRDLEEPDLEDANDLASNGSRRSRTGDATSRTGDATPQSFSPEKRLTAGDAENGAGLDYDPDAGYVPGPDDPTLFSLEEIELAPGYVDPETGRYSAETDEEYVTRRGPAWWRRIENPWEAKT